MLICLSLSEINFYKIYFFCKRNFFQKNIDDTLTKALSGEIKPRKEILSLISIAINAKINE